MSTAVDSNVLSALWNPDRNTNTAARSALEAAHSRGLILIHGTVYAELLGDGGRTQKMLEEFLSATGIVVDWDCTPQLWRTAGLAYQGYSARRKRSGGQLPRRILADFIIGAHAALNHHRLLTFDRKLYRAAFPKLDILEP